jgi:predicted nucleotidyltransferase
MPAKAGIHGFSSTPKSDGNYRHPAAKAPRSKSFLRAFSQKSAYSSPMLSRAELLNRLRQFEPELRASGIESLTLFGSMARGDATPDSDVDLVIRPAASFSNGGFDHFGKLEALRDRLKILVGRDVDLVEEPIIRPRLRQAIEQEGIRAF